MRLAKPFLLSCALMATAATLVVAQNPGKGQPVSAPPVALKEGWGDLHLQTNIGSFKLIDGEGRVEVTFSGSIMVSQLKGKLTPSGNLRKEYDKRGRQAFHGTGKIIVDGQFRAIQWFGTNMRARWVGKGVARITGEFDRNLDTGFYWYGNQTQKMPWSMYGLTIQNPEMVMGGGGTPVPRKPGGGG